MYITHIKRNSRTLFVVKRIRVNLQSLLNYKKRKQVPGNKARMYQVLLLLHIYSYDSFLFQILSHGIFLPIKESRGESFLSWLTVTGVSSLNIQDN